MATSVSTQLNAGQTTPSATHTYRIDFSRTDQGNGTLNFYRDDVLVETQSNAGWDDAIPWEAGSYSLAYNGQHAGSYSWRMSPSPAGRDGILLHQGSQATPSQPLEGCIGATKAFLTKVYDTLKSDGNANAQIGFDVTGDFSLAINASVTKTNLQEGDNTVLTISLDGTDTANGVSKDIWVKLDIGDGTAKLHEDFEIVAIDGGAIDEKVPAGKAWPDGIYVKIPAGRQSVQYRIDVKSDDLEEPAETISLDVSDYFVERVYNGTTTRYSDSLTQPGKLLPAKIDLDVTIGPKEKLTTANVSGGVEGFKHVYLVDVGDTISYSFDAYSIPDSITIGGVSVPVSTGYMSGVVSGTLVATSTDFSVIIVGNDPSTAWYLSLDNLGKPGTSASITVAGAADEPAYAAPDISYAAAASRSDDAPSAHIASASGAAAADTSGATLSQVLSTALSLATDSSVATALFTPVSGKTYFVRVVDDTGAVNDSYVSITAADDPSNPLRFEGTVASDMPAVFIKADSAAALTFAVGSETGQTGPVTLEVYDASSFTGTVFQFQRGSVLIDEADQDGFSVLNLYRYGDVSQAQTVTLVLEPSAGNGFSADDFVSGSLTLTVQFEAGASIATIDLDAVSDGVAEGIETGRLRLDLGSDQATAANMALLGFDTGIDVSIGDPVAGTAYSTPELSASDISVNEDGSSATFTLTLSNALNFEVSASYVTIDNTAVGGEDYVSKSGVVTFAAGQTSATVTIDLLRDGETDVGKSFFLKLLDPYGLNMKDGAQVLTYNATLADGLSDLALSAMSVAENAAAGTVVGTLSVGGGSGQITFSEKDPQSSLFEIVGNQVRVAQGAILDFEMLAQQPVTIEARDANGATITATFDISIADVNEAPSDITLSAVATAENSTAGTVVGVLSAIDPDGDTLVFSETGTLSSLFDVVGNEVRVAQGAVLDYETLKSQQITVQASDGKGETLTKTFDIALLDQQEGYLGGPGADTIRGSNDDDDIRGFGGNDWLYGERGNDKLRGGAGADHLFGGLGADRFIYSTVADSTPKRGGQDTIHLFSAFDGDLVVLKQIDANARKGGNQAFKFIGDDDFHRKAGELRYDFKGSETVIQGDVNGDGKPDLVIRLDLHLSMDRDMFVL